MNVVSDRPVARPPCILNPYLDGVGQVRRPNLYGSKVRKLPLAGDLRASGPERRPRRQNSSLVWVIPSRQIKSKCMMVLRAHMRPVKFYKYMKATTAKTVLKNNRLRWSSPTLFNDRSTCNSICTWNSIPAGS